MLTKQKSFFLIQDGTKYLYWNKAIFSRGYHWKEGKQGATTFDRAKSKRVIKYLKSKGYTEVRKVKVRK